MMLGFDFWAAAEALAVLFGIFGLILVFLARDIDRWPARLCIAILSSALLSAALALLKRAAAQNQVSHSLFRALLCAEALITPLPSLLVFAYFLQCCGENYLKSAAMRIQCALTAALIAAQWLAHLTGAVSITPDYATRAGRWSYVYVVIISALTVNCLIALFLRRKRVTGAQFVMFLVCFFAVDVIQIILVELYLMAELVRRYLMQRDEAAQQRTRAAMAQMRPHFIYNTLMNVYYLCAKDPPRAQRIIRDFTRYLQNNFTAIAQEDTIPFEKELEHTRAYLAVEQACFEGRLFVEFDTPDTFFRIPPLTLQPIVENAVKHGMDPDLEPLYVYVVTRDTARGVKITVEDTGPGFAPTDDDEPNYALKNIRERLKTMCGGTLEIEEREAGGTRVTIFIPQDEGK